jgi:hypothetical protein
MNDILIFASLYADLISVYAKKYNKRKKAFEQFCIAYLYSENFGCKYYKKLDNLVLVSNT